MQNKVLDTNVVMDRKLESVFEGFTEPTRAIFPLVVLEELDKFKTGFDVKNEYARAANRFLDNLRQFGKLHEGVPYGEHIVQVAVTEEELDLNKPDYKIIKTAREHNALLVTQDINIRVIADALGVPSSQFAPNDVNVNELYTGHTVRELKDSEVRDLRLSREVLIEVEQDAEYLHNQLIELTHTDGEVFYGVYDKEYEGIRLTKKRYNAWGVRPKADDDGKMIKEQHYLMHLLLDPEVQFVTAIGPSGCGKTLLALAAALQQTLSGNTYKKVTVMRPLIAIGNDIGYLPGDKLEKLEPWMASTFDALDYLLEDYEEKDHDLRRLGTVADLMPSSKEKIYSLIGAGKLELEAMAHIRGRSIPDQFLIVDDAQNLTQQEAASIITRAAEGTKVVFLGDLSEKQIDNHRLTPSSNGLAYVIDKFKGENIVGHITLNKVVRSPLAQLGVEKL